MPMKKQIPLFPTEADHDFDIWASLPHESQLEIESIFAQILVENLLSSTKKEVKPDES
jgi:hypothetical protein